jgi:ribonuclease HI
MPSSIAKLSPRWFHERRPSDHTRVKKVQLITDGACLGNPGPGGWAAILRHGDHRREMFGYAPLTTNNRMEPTAAIEGLRAIKESCEVEVVTDSEKLTRTVQPNKSTAGNGMAGKEAIRSQC